MQAGGAWERAWGLRSARSALAAGVAGAAARVQASGSCWENTGDQPRWRVGGRVLRGCGREPGPLPRSSSGRRAAGPGGTDRLLALRTVPSLERSLSFDVPKGSSSRGSEFLSTSIHGDGISTVAMPPP